MVDPINPSNQIKQLQTISKSPSVSERDVKKASSAPVDEVSLSDEAISLTDAETKAAQVRDQLTQQDNLTLSGDIKRLSQLI